MGAGGFGVADDGSRVAVYLAEHEPVRSFGAALATRHRYAADRLHLFAASDADTLARIAQHFDVDVTIWAASRAEAARAQPAARPREAAPPRVPHLVALLEGDHVDVVVEHGLITAEVAGLEVARVCHTPEVLAGADAGRAQTGDAADVWQVAVGVGEVDQQAFAVVHRHEVVTDSLRRVASLVARHRSPGAEPHPLNRLAASRWLRAVLCGRPELVGAARLAAASAPVPRTGVKDDAPAVAYGVDQAGGRLVVVAQVGIDLNVVPFAADARDFLDPDAQLRIVTPARDSHRLLAHMASLVRGVATLHVVGDDWRNLRLRAGRLRAGRPSAGRPSAGTVGNLS